MWLQRCYEILADGQWHVREDVIREMTKTVPPALAYRRGVATSRVAENVTRDHLIKRGARQLCHSSINGAGYIENATVDGVWLVRMGDQVQRPPAPILVYPATNGQATHILVPVDQWKGQMPDDAEMVVRP